MKLFIQIHTINIIKVCILLRVICIILIWQSDVIVEDNLTHYYLDQEIQFNIQNVVYDFTTTNYNRSMFGITSICGTIYK